MRSSCLHRQLAACKGKCDKPALDHLIAFTDAEIDPPSRHRRAPLRRGRARLVYELYGLTAAEIAIVEGGGH